ncbi:MAG TPA: Ig-like domain-containing protein, partial [Bryobacteraceae bacterium]
LVFQSAAGNVTIPVVVVVGDNILSQINGISFEKVFAGLDPLPQILTVPSTGTDFNFIVQSSTATGGNWLTVGGFSGCSGGPLCSTPHTISASVNPAVTLAAGTYTGQIRITSQFGAMTITVPVTLTIEAAGTAFFDNLPGQVSFSIVTHSTTATSQDLEIRNGGSGVLNWSVTAITSDGNNWLTVSPATGVAPSLVTVDISVLNLPGNGVTAGTFIGELIFQSPTGAVTVPVSIVVSDNTFHQINAISFTKVFGGVDPLPQTLSVSSTGTNFNFIVASSTATGGNWLTVGGFSGCSGGPLCPTPHTVTVGVSASPTLAVGSYTGQVTFTSQFGNVTITVPVTLTITSPSTAFFDNLPGQVSFSVKTGNATNLPVNPPPQTIQIRNGGSGTLSWNLSTSTSDGGNWLGASSVSGTAPSQVNITIATGNLPGGGFTAGTFIGNLVFRTGSDSTTVPVVVVVGDNILTQINAISFTKIFGGADPLPQVLTVASTGTDFNFTVASSTATGGSWLTVSGFQGCSGGPLCATPHTVFAAVTSSPTLGVGTYTGQITLTSQFGSMTITVPVTLTVVASGAPVFDNVQGQMSFSMKTKGLTPPSQSVQIRNAGSGSLPWTLTTSTSDSGNWLTVSAASGTAPSVVTVSINSANLPNLGLVAGSFVGELVFQSATGSVTVPVSVVVGDNILSQINAISFTKPLGGDNPLPQILTVPSTGTAFNFIPTSATANGGDWLTISGFDGCSGGPLCGTPHTISVSVNPSATLAAGNYTGQVNFTSQFGNMTITVPVTLTVEAPTTPFFDNVQGQMSFSFTTGSGNPPSQDVLFRNEGSGTLNFAALAITSDGGNWLSVSPASGVAPSKVTANINVANLPNQGLVAGTFIGELIFSSSTGSVTVPVSVTVGPNVFVQLSPINFSMPPGGPAPVPQNLTISSTGTNFNFIPTSATGNGGAWLSISGFSGCSGGPLCGTPHTITASVVTTPPAGTYTGQIVATTQFGSEAMTIPVILTVGAGGPTLQSIAVTPANPSIAKGTTQQFTATGTYSDSSTQNLTGQVTWTSATTSVATITATGLATGAGTGTSTIRATLGAVSGSTVLTVTVTISPTVVSYNVVFGLESFNVIGSTRNRLPWEITGIRVVFSEPIAQGTVNSLGGVTATGLSGLGTNTLTWTISPLTLGNFATTLAGTGANALKDAAGNALGGGAGFSQGLKILWGDFNDDGVVSASDLTGVNNAAVATYNPFADMNGDGVVNTADIQVVRTRIGTMLP